MDHKDAYRETSLASGINVWGLSARKSGRKKVEHSEIEDIYTYKRKIPHYNRETETEIVWLQKQYGEWESSERSAKFGTEKEEDQEEKWMDTTRE